jgi:hypothetical protein
VTIPNVLVFQFGFTLLAPAMDAALLWTVAGSAVSLALGSPAAGGTLPLIVAYWAVFQTIDAIAAVIGVALDPNRGGMRLLPLIVLQRFTYRQLLYITAARALLVASRGTFVGWGKLLRTGSVAVGAFFPAAQPENTGGSGAGSD